MEYCEFKPKRELEPFIKCYWTVTGIPNESERIQTILPDGCNDIVFIMGDDLYKIYSKTEKIKMPRFLVSGQLSKPQYYHMNGYMNVFGIRFLPFGFYPLINFSSSLLTDNYLSLDKIFSKDDSEYLYYAVENTESIMDKITIVEKFLCKKIKITNGNEGISKNVIGQFNKEDRMLHMNLMAKETEYNLRRIQRHFAKEVGLSPKKLERIIRLKTSVKMLQDNVNLISIANEMGYCDQAHFINDFRKLTGCTPGTLSSNPEYLISNYFLKEII